MRNFVLVITCLLMILLAGGCSSQEDSSTTVAPQNTQVDTPAVTYDPNQDYTPSDVVANYFYALQEGNFTVAKKYLAREAQLKKSDDSLQQLGNEIRDYNLQIIFQKEEGKFAKVKYLFSGMDQENFKQDEMYLLSEDGKWKIILEKPSPNPFATQEKPGVSNQDSDKAE